MPRRRLGSDFAARRFRPLPTSDREAHPVLAVPLAPRRVLVLRAVGLPHRADVVPPSGAHAASPPEGPSTFAWRRTLRIYPAVPASRSPGVRSPFAWRPAPGRRRIGRAYSAICLPERRAGRRSGGVQHPDVVAVLRDDVLSRVPARGVIYPALPSGLRPRAALRARRCGGVVAAVGHRIRSCRRARSPLFVRAALRRVAPRGRGRACARALPRRPSWRPLSRGHHRRDVDALPPAVGIVGVRRWLRCSWSRIASSRATCRVRSDPRAVARARPRQLLVLSPALDDRGAGRARGGGAMPPPAAVDRSSWRGFVLSATRRRGFVVGRRATLLRVQSRAARPAQLHVTT